MWKGQNSVVHQTEVHLSNCFGSQESFLVLDWHQREHRGKRLRALSVVFWLLRRHLSAHFWSKQGTLSCVFWTTGPKGVVTPPSVHTTLCTPLLTWGTSVFLHHCLLPFTFFKSHPFLLKCLQEWHWIPAPKAKLCENVMRSDLGDGCTLHSRL